jgi:hypothetical protein
MFSNIGPQVNDTTLLTISDLFAVLPSVILRSVIRLQVFMLSVILKSVIMLNVAALSSGNWSKPFFFVIMRQNKQECLFLAHVVQANVRD